MVLKITPTSSQVPERGVPPTHRGLLLTAAQVAELLFSGTVSAAWVRRNVPYKLVLGHSTVRWYEYDVQAWIAQAETTCGPASVTV